MDVFKLVGEQDWDGENDRPGYRHRTTAEGYQGLLKSEPKLDYWDDET